MRLSEGCDIQPFQLYLSKAETLLSDYYMADGLGRPRFHSPNPGLRLTIKEGRTRIS